MKINVRIVPNTARLKQLVREHGNIWTQLSDSEPMQCFNGDHGTRIRSLDETHVRNVRSDIVLPYNTFLPEDYNEDDNSKC